MKQILAIDVGTGTQDVFLLRLGLSPENGYKLIMPSPTMRIRQDIMRATSRGEAVLLTGVTMGGGPSQWAAENHHAAGLSLYATPEAAQTFNDDLNWVKSEMGVEIVSEDEAAALTNCTRVHMQDLDLPALHSAFEAFGVKLEPALAALAVFDHGAAPPEVSDRKFRFDLIERQVRASKLLTTFAFKAEDIPPAFTRMRAIGASAQELDCPVVLMDTAPAAVLGATLDPIVDALDNKLIANVGNYHTLAFRLGRDGIEGLFEHHTGMLNQASLERLLTDLAAGTISGEQVFQDKGHGALMLDRARMKLHSDTTGVIVTGPRRALMMGSKLNPFFAVPLGDMMLTGCFGLLIAAAEKHPEWGMQIQQTLSGQDAHIAPWDVDSP